MLLRARALALFFPDAVSMESEIADGLSIADLMTAPLDQTPEALLLRQDAAVPVRQGMALLNAKEQLVLRMRFGFVDDEEQTLESTARLLGRSKERVRQIQKIAIIKLRHYLRTGAMPAIYYDGCRVRSFVGRGRRRNGNGARDS